MDYRLHPERFFRHMISFPFIWMMIFPLMLFDIFLEIYHRICFYLYGLDYVSRSEYIRIDRQRLSYLTMMERINCMYCGYANGLMAYGTEIAGKTEKYWCGIKHEEGGKFNVPEHHKDFLDFGDVQGFIKKFSIRKP